MKTTHLVATAAMCMGTFGAQAADQHNHHTPSNALDKRVMLSLTPTERTMILEEMHLFLAGVQSITAALASQDMPAAAQSARKLGVVMAHEVPLALREKLPLGFRQIGSSVHQDFDQLAMDAETLKDVSHSLGQLSATLNKCASCHATYQIGRPAIEHKR